MDVLNLIISFVVPSFVTVVTLYGVYFFFLRKDADFQRNRWFIVGSLLFSLAISFININVVVDAAVDYKPLDQNIMPNIMLDEFVKNPDKSLFDFFMSLSFLSVCAYIYLAGVAVSFLLFLYKLGKLLVFINKSPKERKSGYILVITDKDINTFSFFKYLVINEEDYNSLEFNQIIIHEEEHIKQHHCIDLLIAELVIILQWFNPFAYLFRKELKDVHEFIADKAVLDSSIRQSEYMKLMLYQATGMNFSLLGNAFSHKLTLKRIKMMKTKKRSWSVAKVAFALPVVAVLMAVFCVTARPDNSVDSKFALSCGTDIPISDDSLTVKCVINGGANDTTVYQMCSESPSFPGGTAALTKFLGDNIKYPEAAKVNKISGTVFVAFVVEKDGSVSNVTILRGLSAECDAEVLRVMNLMPKWNPGKNADETVRVKYTIPFKFFLPTPEEQ
ncbi:MAG: M56 family metallopeptidase [Bacteroidales bacterium]|nr:M56 family metallopeptidase [Bacteroidales bacterium]MDD2204949.1 M56 family metallopeptidase [Bacteroidales bacterium]MDD3152174.1 M56 family metallopeptidase [Bacteroidales bacterium]MDD3913890.1 M56 family metallopeptidase [Bacteroidales bacterium]MDD4634270.1 M56 family metallopeptidase [Bacteroidales bacterium]